VDHLLGDFRASLPASVIPMKGTLAP